MNGNAGLLERYADGDMTAEAELVEKNMGLVRSLAVRFTYSGVDYEDLCQIGSVGLLRAIRNFDTSKGVMFSTYAVPVILGEIRKYLRDDGLVKVSRTLREQYVAVRRASEAFEKENERPPTLGELSARTGLSAEEILTATEAVGAPQSLDEPLSDGEDGTLGEKVGEDKEEEQMMSLALKESLSRLEAKDRQLIVLRYFNAKTQQETAQILNMTQVQVSRREKKIIDTLRREMAD